MSPVFNCYECNNEFTVDSSYDTDDTVSFCPYCGSEIEQEEEIKDEDFDEDYRD